MWNKIHWWYQKSKGHIKLAFRAGRILTELTWIIMVKIPKGGGKYIWI